MKSNNLDTIVSGRAVWFICLTAILTFSIDPALLAQTAPKYNRAAYAGEQVSLENDHLRINVFKRVGGWGWGEIHTASG